MNHSNNHFFTNLHHIHYSRNQKSDFSFYFYLHKTDITKVMAGSMLLIAQEKVGDVNFNPA